MLTTLRDALGDLPAFHRDPLATLAHRAPPGASSRLRLGPSTWCISNAATAATVLKDPRFVKAPAALGPLQSLPALTALQAVIGDSLPVLDDTAAERRRALAPVFADAHTAVANTDVSVLRARLHTLVAECRTDHVDIYAIVARLVVEGVLHTFFGDRCVDWSAEIADVIDSGNEALDVVAKSALPWALSWPLPAPRAIQRARATLLAFAARAVDAMASDARFARVTTIDRAALLDEVLTQLVAGTETTALSICWTLVWLQRSSSSSPSWLEAIRAQGDVAQPHLGGDDPLSLCLRESLRLSPPFWQTPRVASEDIVVDGHAIAAHSFVMVCLYLANRDPALGEQVEAFVPDRPRIAQPLTFGVGPRSCIGARLSFVTAHRVLHTLLRDFDVVIDNDAAPARPLIFGLKREGGFRAALHRR